MWGASDVIVGGRGIGCRDRGFVWRMLLTSAAAYNVVEENIKRGYCLELPEFRGNLLVQRAVKLQVDLTRHFCDPSAPAVR